MTAVPRLDPAEWRRLLVLAPNWIGDAVMSEPSLRAIHEAHPGLEILVSGRSAPLLALEGHPAISATIETDDRGVIGWWTAGRRLAALRPDAVLLLRGSLRSALVALATRCERRIGVDRDGRRPLLTHAMPRPDRDGRPQPTSLLYESLAAMLDVTVIDRRPRLTPSRAMVDQAAAMLADLRRPIVGLVPGGSKVAKRWPAARFAELVDRCRDRVGAAVLFGSPNERAVIGEVLAARRGGPPIVDLGARGLDARVLTAAIGGCDALVTNDTGPRHLAIAQGVPTVSLFGPTDHRWTIVPGARERMLLAEPFLDDEHVADRHPKACRIDRIPVGDAAWALRAALSESNPDQRISSGHA